MEAEMKKALTQAGFVMRHSPDELEDGRKVLNIVVAYDPKSTKGSSAGKVFLCGKAFGLLPGTEHPVSGQRVKVSVNLTQAIPEERRALVAAKLGWDKPAEGTAAVGDFSDKGFASLIA